MAMCYNYGVKGRDIYVKCVVCIKLVLTLIWISTTDFALLCR